MTKNKKSKNSNSCKNNMNKKMNDNTSSCHEFDSNNMNGCNLNKSNL